MPYVRQKTWLALAPRIAGLSVRESPYGFRGLGSVNLLPAAPCYDDSGNAIACGGSSGGLTIVNPDAPVSTAQYPVTYPGYQPATTGPTGPSQSLGQWLQANQNIVLLAGAGLFGLALLKGFK